MLVSIQSVQERHMATPDAVSLTPPRRLNHDFWKFWCGQACSNLGSSFSLFALPLLVFTLTGSAINLAIASAVTALPGILFGLLIGAWVDRTNRKRLMIGTDILRALVIASIPMLVAFNLLTIGWIYFVGFASAALATCFTAAQTTAIVSLVASDDLVAANGRIQASYSAVSILAPLLAGMLATLLPLSSLLLLDALTFLISALSLAWIHTSFNRLGTPPTTNIGAAIWEGVTYLIHHPILRLLAIFGLLLNFVVATIGAQLVLFAKDHLQATNAQLGMLYTAQSIGVFGFALLAGYIRKRVRFSRVILGAVILHGLLTVMLSLSPFYWLAVGCLAGMAGLIALLGINVLSLRQAIVPNHLLGRVSSSLSVLVGIAMPLGTLVGGFAIEQTQSVQGVFATIGCLISIIGVVFVCTPLRTAERYLSEQNAE